MKHVAWRGGATDVTSFDTCHKASGFLTCFFLRPLDDRGHVSPEEGTRWGCQSPPSHLRVQINRSVLLGISLHDTSSAGPCYSIASDEKWVPRGKFLK